MIAGLLHTDWRKLGQKSSLDMGQRWSSMNFLCYSDSNETKITENVGQACLVSNWVGEYLCIV
jgi:hypothetical protein